MLEALHHLRGDSSTIICTLRPNQKTSNSNVFGYQPKRIIPTGMINEIYVNPIHVRYLLDLRVLHYVAAVHGLELQVTRHLR